MPRAKLLVVPDADHFQAHFRSDVILPAVSRFLSKVEADRVAVY